MKKLSRKLQDRYTDAIWMHREQWRTFLDEAYHYISPNRNSWRTSRTIGDRENLDIYDITAVLASRTFVSKLHSSLTPPFQKWAQLESGSLVPDTERDANNQQLQVITNKLFRQFHQSKVDLTLNEAYQDLNFGTAAIRIDEGDDENPLIFSSVPTSTIAFEESPYGDIRTTWQQYFKLKHRDIMEIWPQAKFPEHIIRTVEQNPEYEIDVSEGFVWNNEEKNYSNFVFLDSYDIIYEDTLESSPLLVFRWGKMAGEIFGRGIAHEVLPTVKTLNKMIEFMFRASELSMAPPLMAGTDNVFNPKNLRLEPNTIITVESLLGGAPLQTLDVNPNLQLAQLEIQELQNWINKAYFAEPFGAITDPTKTATEIAARQQLLLEEIGAAFGRLEAEFLSKLIDRCVYVLQKKGIIPKLTIDGKEVRIKYLSPLAQIQDNQDIRAFVQAVELNQQIYGPQLSLAMLNNAEVSTWIANKTHAPLQLFKTDEQVQKIIQGMLKSAQQQQAQLQQPQAAPPLGQ